MKVYEINEVQTVPAGLDAVFDFFSKPENLAELTPAHMHFNILTPSPVQMKEGAIIDYTIRVAMLDMQWRTIITTYDPPHKFIDEQIKGPYAFWHHTHIFKDTNDGTLIQDKVRYALPFGMAGRIAHALWVSKQLNTIFSYRRQTIVEIMSVQS